MHKPVTNIHTLTSINSRVKCINRHFNSSIKTALKLDKGCKSQCIVDAILNCQNPQFFFLYSIYGKLKMFKA